MCGSTVGLQENLCDVQLRDRWLGVSKGQFRGSLRRLRLDFPAFGNVGTVEAAGEFVRSRARFIYRLPAPPNDPVTSYKSDRDRDGVFQDIARNARPSHSLLAIEWMRCGRNIDPFPGHAQSSAWLWPIIPVEGKLEVSVFQWVRRRVEIERILVSQFGTNTSRQGNAVRSRSGAERGSAVKNRGADEIERRTA